MFPTVEEKIVQNVLLTSGNSMEVAIEHLLRLPSHQLQRQSHAVPVEQPQRVREPAVPDNRSQHRARIEDDEEDEDDGLVSGSRDDFGLYNADEQATATIECVPIVRRKLNWGDIKKEEIKGQPTKLAFTHGTFGTTFEAQLVDSQGSKIAVKVVQPLAGVNIDRLFEECVRTYKYET